MATTPGYSGKPLYQKLGLKPGMSCKPIGAPDNYLELVAGAEDVKISPRLRSANLVHIFCRSEADLTSKLERGLAATTEGGMLWISWPKKSSPLFRDLTEDGIRRLVLPTGWVDVKVCAVDEDWSGLKFLRRRN